MSVLKIKQTSDSSTSSQATIKTPKIKLSSGIDAQKSTSIKQAYGTGKRKDAVARVWVKEGSGRIVINNKLIDQYFSNDAHKIQLLMPFTVTETKSQYDIFCTVKGGGSSGQAGAIRHGVAKALDILAPEFHKTLRANGLLTRDSRVVERKKYGLRKARKSTQFSKR